MAQFQLSVSKTYVVNTDTWEQPGRDTFTVALEKVGFDGKGTPSTQQCVDALRQLLDTDEGEFWDAHIDLGLIEPKDVKVVCFSRQFDRLQPQDKSDVKAPPDGNAKVASKPPATKEPPVRTSTPTLAEGVNDPTKKTATGERVKSPAETSTAVPGARDSKQVTK